MSVGGPVAPFVLVDEQLGPNEYCAADPPSSKNCVTPFFSKKILLASMTLEYTQCLGNTNNQSMQCTFVKTVYYIILLLKQQPEFSITITVYMHLLNP